MERLEGSLEVSTVAESRFTKSSTLLELGRILKNDTSWGRIHFFRIYFIPDKELIKRYPNIKKGESFLFASIENLNTGDIEHYLQKSDGTWKEDPVRVPASLMIAGRCRTYNEEHPKHKKIIEWMVKVGEML